MNKKESAKYFEMAAEKGDPEGMTYYGSVLSRGDGIATDKREAARYFKTAADKGRDEANDYYELVTKEIT